MLMNACAGCHAREDCAGSYKLKRVDAEYANAEGVERNLLATVKQLDRADPGASPFLAKAVEAHGKAKDAPLRSKAHPAYKYLEVWAHWATMREGSPMPVSIPQAVAKRTEPAAPIRQAAAVVKSEELPKASAVPLPVAKSSVAEPKAADPGDPFDPAAFNRAAHPQRK